MGRPRNEGGINLSLNNTRGDSSSSFKQSSISATRQESKAPKTQSMCPLPPLSMLQEAKEPT